jgi:hypothetical protein
MIPNLLRRSIAGFLRSFGRYVLSPMVMGFGRRPSGPECHVPVHMLVSSKTWQMGVLALLSFEYFTGRRWRIFLHEDGSIDDRIRRLVERKLPGVRFVPRKEADERVAVLLRDHPACLRNRGRHNLFLKYFDPLAFAGSDRYIVLDSDLFFFARPAEILQWVDEAQDATYYNQDTKEVYALGRAPIEKVMGFSLWDRFNSGLVLIPRASVSLDLAEKLLSTFEASAPHPQFFEQTLHALQASAYGKGGPLPPTYEISWTLWRQPGSVCRHYVGPFKFDNLYIEGPATLLLRMTLPGLLGRRQ